MAALRSVHGLPGSALGLGLAAPQRQVDARPAAALVLEHDVRIVRPAQGVEAQRAVLGHMRLDVGSVGEERHPQAQPGQEAAHNGSAHVPDQER